MREIERLRDSLIAALEAPGLLRDRLKVGVLSVTEGTRGDFDQLIRDFESHFDGEPTCLPHNGKDSISASCSFRISHRSGIGRILPSDRRTGG